MLLPHEIMEGIMVKDGPVVPMLKEIRKEALEHISLALRI